jgi:2-dehydro-3-deoxyglucarate aldolase
VSASFRERLRRGDLLVGPMVCLTSPEVVEILCGAGFDWLFLEAEHAPASPQTLQHMMIAARDVPCVVRLPNHDEIWVKRVLDMGAAGVIVPQVNTAAQARDVVRYAKYAPMGGRGAGVSRAHGYEHGNQSSIGVARVAPRRHRLPPILPSVSSLVF